MTRRAPEPDGTDSRRRHRTESSAFRAVAGDLPATAPGATVVMVPGYTGSGPQHWQTLWERENPEYRRVEQANWDDPVLEEWVTTLDRFLERMRRPVVLVGHSCGALTVVHWSVRHGPGAVVAALLVAPADADAADAIPAVRAFAPLPTRPLPFPSLLVASDNDPYLKQERARRLAAVWGSRLRCIPGAGHLNTASGYGAWPEGKRLLVEVCTLAATHPAEPAREGEP